MAATKPPAGFAHVRRTRNIRRSGLPAPNFADVGLTCSVTACRPVATLVTRSQAVFIQLPAINAGDRHSYLSYIQRQCMRVESVFCLSCARLRLNSTGGSIVSPRTKYASWFIAPGTSDNCIGMDLERDSHTAPHQCFDGGNCRDNRKHLSLSLSSRSDVLTNVRCSLLASSHFTPHT